MAALRFSFVGDLHLDSRTPSSRLDDYAQATLSKLQLVLEGCQAHNSTHLFLSGDVFHRRAQSFDYLSKVIAAFRQFKQAGVQVHSIVGNHDIQHDRMDTLSSNPLGLLFEIGLIQRLSEEGLRLPFVFSSDINSRPQVLIRGVDYGKPLPARVAKTDLNLSFVVAHAFYDNALDSHAFSFEEVRASGHDYLLLGHDHAPYPPLLVGQTKVIRPGSLTRGTSHDYQLHRPIQIEHFQVSEPLLVALHRGRGFQTVQKRVDAPRTIGN